jgi:two-component system response regulator PilR (NtrC family)
MAPEENHQDSHAPPAGDPGGDPARASPSPWLVVLCDGEPDRRALVSQIVTAAGGAVRIVDGFALARISEVPTHTLAALVAAGNETVSANPHLATITACKNAGLTVIAYENGVRHWPVRAKCLPLLAGAAHLLDSGCAEFAPQLREILAQTVRALTQERRELQEIRDAMRRHGLVGESPAMLEVFRAATRFSQLSDLPVLITGESGTSKELLARAIAAMDPKRKDGPFIPINCAAINSTLMESEFFGHRRGAFTGAERDRKGLIRAAEGGTLFLDEIGELDPSLQAKLLRVLQENRVLTIGEEQETPVNVRFIAATNQDLERLVAERKFRGDLFHRLRVLSVHIPPIRERSADIAPLVRHLLQKRHSLQAASTLNATGDFLEAIRQLDFPGNVRQLENLIYHALAYHSTARPLDLNDLPPEAMRLLTCRTQTVFSAGARLEPDLRPLLRELTQTEMNELVKRILDGQGWNLSKVLRECERHVFQAAMQRTGGNQSQTARLLGITPRSVYNKIHRHRLQGLSTSHLE